MDTSVTEEISPPYFHIGPLATRNGTGAAQATIDTDIRSSQSIGRNREGSAILFPEQRRKRLKAYQDDMLSFAHALSKDGDLARDLCQECAVRVLRARTTPKDDRAYKAWVFTILRNLWLDHIRRSNRRGESRLDDMEEQVAAPLEAEVSMVNAIAVRMAFEQLSDDHRDILALVDIGGFRYEEAAEFLGVSIGTVMSRVSRARSRMCALLDRSNIVDIQIGKKQARRYK